MTTAPRPPVRGDLSELTGYHSPQLDVSVRLNTNESPVSPPAGFAAAVAEAALEIDWHRYPDRSALELRTAIGKGFGLGADHVFVANGSNEVLQTLLLTYVGHGRTALTFEPTYALHRHLTMITGGTAVAAQRDDDYAITADTATEAVRAHRPAVTFLCSPNNPTGMVETPETIMAVLDAVESVGGLLVVDEAYGEFAAWSAVELLDDDRPLVVVKTYSKTWAMAGARLGYLLGPTWLVERLFTVVLPYHLDALKQAAGLAALRFEDEMTERVDAIVAERERIQRELVDRGVTVWPSDANFILFRAAVEGNTLWQHLVDRSVLIRNTASWDRLDGCLRVTVGTQEENDRFLDALDDILNHV